MNSKKVKAFLLQHFLPIGLVVCTFLGLVLPGPGIALGKTDLNTVSIVGIFFISGLQLRTDELVQAIKSVPGIVFGFLSILALSPLLAFWIVKWNLGPPEFARGLAIFLAMPTTISSGVILTGEAHGNVALALFLSSTTNVIGTLTCPFFVAAILKDALGEGADIDSSSAFSPVKLLVNLLLSILLPLIVGKLCRFIPRVVPLVNKHKTFLKLTSAALLISVPYMSVSEASDLLKGVAVKYILLLVLLGVVIHLALLIANGIVCHSMGKVNLMKKPEQIAVLISNSQKTVNTALSVISYLPPAAGAAGLLTLPCLIAHLTQILVDSFLIGTFSKRLAKETGSLPTVASDSTASSGSEHAAGDDIAAAHQGGLSSDTVAVLGPDEGWGASIDTAQIDVGINQAKSVQVLPPTPLQPRV